MLREGRWGIDLHDDSSHIQGQNFRKVAIYQPRRLELIGVTVAKASDVSDADYEVRVEGDDPEAASHSTLVLHLEKRTFDALADALHEAQWTERHETDTEKDYEPADG